MKKFCGTVFPASLLLLVLLFYFRPYYGIRHDSVLYLGQSLLRLDPDNFKSDLFFSYGSQADFTLVPRLIAPLLGNFDAVGTFLVLTALCLVLFLLASTTLLATLFPSSYWYWGALALLVLPGSYGGYGVFSYAEPFFTARSLAEPLVLLSLAAYFRGRLFITSGLWLAAAALHPLQALPALFIFWSDRISHDRRWLHALWLPVLLLVAGALGLPYTDKWMTQYDAQWFKWIREPNRHVFLFLWTAKDWSFLFADFFLATLLLFDCTGYLRRLARAVLFAAILCFLCSLLFVDVFHFVLPTGLQLWRIQWLLHWLAMASVPYLIHKSYLGCGAMGVRVWLLVTIVILGVPFGGTGSAAVAIWILIPLYLGWPRLESQANPTIRRIVLIAIALALSIVLLRHGFLVYAKFSQGGNLRDVMRPEFAVLTHPLVAGAVIFMIMKLYLSQARWRSMLVILLLPALTHAAVEWDRRSTWTRYIESARNDSKLFGFELEPGAQVLWVDELVAPWLILHRPSYFNTHQTAGLLFNRDTAQEAFNRQTALKKFNFQFEICRLMNGLNQSEDSCTIDVGAVTELCSDSAGKLNYVVLDTKLQKPSAGSWKIRGGLKGDRDITYHIYPCRDFSTKAKS